MATNWWQVGAAAVGAAAVVGGLGYMLTRDSTSAASTEPAQENRKQTDLFTSQSVLDASDDNEEMISELCVPLRPNITNLNSLLADIHVRYIMLRREDFRLHYRVFCEVFGALQRHMRAVDKYYERYASNAGHSEHDALRSWRLALQDQEKQLLKNTYHLRQVVRLLKKFRDAQGMRKISSYYIKTLFFLEIVENKDVTFWQRNDLATLFKYMLRKFYEAIDKGIPYFWNKSNDMIEHLEGNVKNEYKIKIGALLNILEAGNYKLVAKYILTAEEYLDYQLLVLTNIA